jgi:hypothetical protein
MRRPLALASATFFALIAAGRGAAAAPDLPVERDPPLVYKAPPPARSVAKVNPVRLSNPPKETEPPHPPKDAELFRRFLEWLKTQPR